MPLNVSDVLYAVRWHRERMLDAGVKVRSSAEALGLLHDCLEAFGSACRKDDDPTAAASLCQMAAVAAEAIIELDLPLLLHFDPLEPSPPRTGASIGAQQEPTRCAAEPCAFRGCDRPVSMDFKGAGVDDWSVCEAHRMAMIRSLQL